MLLDDGHGVGVGALHVATGSFAGRLREHDPSEACVFAVLLSDATLHGLDKFERSDEPEVFLSPDRFLHFEILATVGGADGVAFRDASLRPQPVWVLDVVSAVREEVPVELSTGNESTLTALELAVDDTIVQVVSNVL